MINKQLEQFLIADNTNTYFESLDTYNLNSIIIDIHNISCYPKKYSNKLYIKMLCAFFIQVLPERSSYIPFKFNIKLIILKKHDSN